MYFRSLIPRENQYVLSESFLHLPLRPIFRQSHPNFINVRTAYASEIWAQLAKNLLAKSSTKRFREYIHDQTAALYLIPYNRALQMAAATLLPPFLPSATMYGVSFSERISSFDWITLTKPTGAPMIRAGFIFPSRISS